MSILQLAIRSFSHYIRSNLVLALGVAIATAVLTGALIVGDSMRNSLRALALDRLGEIDEIIVADGFFRAELAAELRETEAFRANYDIAEAGILFPNGTVEARQDQSSTASNQLARASKVNVFGISDSFWSLADDSLSDLPDLRDSQVIINRALADALGLDTSGESDKETRLTLRIPKPTQLPSDSALGKKEGLIESLVGLEIAAIVPNKSIARFGLHVSQFDSPNIFVPYPLIDDALRRGALNYKSGPQANAIFLSRNDADGTDEEPGLVGSLSPSIGDLGLSIKEASQLRADSDMYVFRYYSLSSDRLVLSDEIAELVRTVFPDATEVFTYLANDIRKESEPTGIPFSMVSALELNENFELVDLDGQPIPPLDEFELVLNQWAADDLGVKVGDPIVVSYFEPESTHNSQEEKQVAFKLKAIAKLAKPDSEFRVRRDKVTRPQYLSESPTLANDPDLTPVVPGLTDAESIERWDLPFETADRIRTVDDDYWSSYRTTPKAFVAPKRAGKLWRSRFGSVTSFRVPRSAGTPKAVEEKLLTELRSSRLPLVFKSIPIRQQAVAASSGSTPFDALFLALSMFVIASALILVALLFRLALKRRASELGALLAAGIGRGRVSRVLLSEMLMVTAIGVLIGIGLGIGYAGIVIHGLKTWWLGAIAKPIIDLHVTPRAIAIGAFSALLICFLTIMFAVRSTRKQSVGKLLAGELAANAGSASQQSTWRIRIVVLLLVFAFILSVVASFLGGEPQAGAFMGSGFLVLAAGLIATYHYLCRSEQSEVSKLSLNRLASMAGKRNPLRSTLTVGLVSVASFLIVAVSSFRLSPTQEGTGGFNLIATSERPIFERINERADLPINTFAMRVKSGEDASCNNLYQSSQPRVVGVPERFIEHYNDTSDHFRWASTSAASAGGKHANPWNLLDDDFGEDVIPVVIDKNTANYSLKIFAVGTDYRVDFDSGESVVFRVVGFLENSILQGSLIISEDNFVKLFPNLYGYRQFLIQEVAGGDRVDGEATSNSKNSGPIELANALETRFSDQGLDVESSADVLAKFQQVQNTYISTFQTLGALGLLLGTFGLAAVQIRSVLERQKELGVMRSVGFSRSQLSKLVLLENAWLLAAGLLIGVGSALVTTLPHFVVGGASVPWIDLCVLFLAITLFGLLAAWLASRVIAKLPLIESLRVG